MFDLGTQELILIFIVALLVFGPKKLPELGRTLGRGIRELKTALRGVQESLEEAETSVSEEIKEAKTSVEENISREFQQVIDKAEGKEEKAETNKNG
jgi:TatA/E family protein of Tat protein translocase